MSQYVPQPVPEWCDIIAAKDAEIKRLKMALAGLIPFAVYQLSEMEKPRNPYPLKNAIEEAEKCLS